MGALIAVLALAAGLRVLAWHNAVMMMNDGPNFLWQAERLLDGDWAAACSHPYHPLYGALTALVSFVTGDVTGGAVTVSIASGLVLCLASWGLAKRAFPDTRGAPAAAALVAALNTRTLDVTADIQADGLFAALVLSAVWALVEAASRGGCRRRLALTGALIGLAYSTRLEGLFVLMAPGLWVAAGGVWGPAGEAARRVRACLPLVALLLACMAPYLIALHGVTGQWVLSLKPSAGAVGLGVRGDPWLAPAESPLGWPVIYADRSLLAAAAAAADDGIADDGGPAAPVEEGALGPALPWDLPPLGLAAGPRMSALRAINASLSQFIAAVRLEMLLLSFPGLLLLWRRARRLALGLLALLIGWLLVCAVQVHHSYFLANRHMILAVALLLPVAGGGVAAWWARGVTTRVVVVLCLLISTYSGARPQRTHHQPRLEALAWVSEHTDQDSYIVGHRQRDGWYAHRPSITGRFPFKDETLLRMLRRYDVSAFVLTLKEVQHHSPHWLEQGLVSERARFGEGDETVLVLEPRFPL